MTNPLDAKAFADKPCTSLTTTQLKPLGLRAGFEGHGEEYDQSNWNCTYLNKTDPWSEFHGSVNYYPNISTGLSSLYEEHADGDWPQWTPTEIDGYPAVFYSDKDPVPSPYECRLDIGISDSSVVNIWVRNLGAEGPQETCATATRIAPAVLATIKSAT